MTSSTQIKGLLAGIAAVAIVGTAMAQGNPPNPAVKSAPIGAGQQSSQKTPMGETGVQGQASGTMMGTTTPASSGTTMGAAPSTTDTTVAAAPRRARADRN